MSKNVAPRQKYWISATVGGAVWTVDRLASSGYVHDGVCVCELCGEPDFSFHRQLACTDPTV
eukprot:2684928-Pyramimonas_sp.AAC.1